MKYQVGDEVYFAGQWWTISKRSATKIDIYTGYYYDQPYYTLAAGSTICTVNAKDLE